MNKKITSIILGLVAIFAVANYIDYLNQTSWLFDNTFNDVRYYTLSSLKKGNTEVGIIKNEIQKNIDIAYPNELEELDIHTEDINEIIYVYYIVEPWFVINEKKVKERNEINWRHFIFGRKYLMLIGERRRDESEDLDEMDVFFDKELNDFMENEKRDGDSIPPK